MSNTPNTPARERPLSPFTSIYRWPVTMATSITHRITGVGMALGLILVAWLVIALANGPGAYETFTDAAQSPLGRLVLFGFAWAVSFHLFNGIRHLAWDMGFGFKLPTASATGIAVYVLSILGAIGLFALAYCKAGLL